jgi:hypothetical protein
MSPASDVLHTRVLYVAYMQQKNEPILLSNVREALI